jgi:sulfatase maturation enzyme AslB (radical SAM superfamily)
MLEFSLLKDLVEYSQKKAISQKKSLKFKIATNFLLMNTEKALFLKENNFGVHISLNGTKALNDAMRDGSTDLLLKNLLKYRDTIGIQNIVILLAFSNKEVASLFKSVYSINKL